MTVEPADGRPSAGAVLRLLVPVGLATWSLALVVSVRAHGIPVTRDRVLFWVLTLLVVVGIDRPRRLARSLLLHWTPFLLALVAYDLMRGQADDLSSRAHVQPALAFDRLLFGGTVPTVSLQRQLWHGTPGLVDAALGLLYLTHFVVPLLLAVVLWRRDERAFLRWMAGLLSLTAAAFVTYVAYPAVPPWLAAKQGHLAAVARLPGQSLRAFGLDPATAALPTGQTLSNPVAALPSLHAAVPCLVLLMFFGGAAWWLRAVLVAYAVGMAFTLVYGGEHYVFDVLLGWAYAAAVATALARLGARRAGGGRRPDSRQRQPAGPLPSPTTPWPTEQDLAGTPVPA